MDHDEFKILLEKIEKIEKKLNPPLWKKVTAWMIDHAIVLLFLFLMMYVLWEVWTTVNDVLEYTKNIDDSLIQYFEEKIAKYKFW